MFVLPRPLLKDALAGALPVSLVPSDAGYFPNAAFHYVERASGSPQVILIFCVGGRGWLRLGGTEYTIESGQVALVLSNEPHVYGSSEEQAWSIYWCHAAGRVAARVASLTVERNGSPVVSVADHARLAALFREIVDELAHGYGLPHLLAASLTLGHLMGCVYSESGRSTGGVPTAAMRARSVAGYMRQHLERPVSLEELARMANLSVSHFSAVFRKELGFSPIDYLTRTRIRRACELLDTSGASLKEIAESVGFSDPLYFSRVFRGIHGVSPSQYRAVIKG
jgi:AraC family transcriptional regulator, arabinose operon regulatory protein